MKTALLLCFLAATAIPAAAHAGDPEPPPCQARQDLVKECERISRSAVTEANKSLAELTRATERALQEGQTALRKALNSPEVAHTRSEVESTFKQARQHADKDRVKVEKLVRKLQHDLQRDIDADDQTEL